MRLVIHAWRELAHPQAGGSEHLVDQLASGMSERGHRVHLICGDPVEARPYAVTGAGGTFGQYLRMPLLDRRLATDVDVALDVANGVAHCTPLWRRGPTILLVHHLHTDQWRQAFPQPIAAFGSWLERRFIPRVYRDALVIAVSPSTAEAISSLGIPESRIRLVQNAVDLPLVTHSEPCNSTPTFVALGRLVPHKRVDRLLTMWERVRPLVGGRLLIMGDGPERTRLEQAAGSDVEILGRVDDDTKHRLLSEAWLLVHAASHEGWGIAVTEAAAHGTPALAFDVPGVRDAVVDGHTGRLAASDDDFVRLWVALAKDPASLRSLGAAARERAALAGSSATVDRFEEVALEAIERGRSRRPARRV